MPDRLERSSASRRGVRPEELRCSEELRPPHRPARRRPDRPRYLRRRHQGLWWFNRPARCHRPGVHHRALPQPLGLAGTLAPIDAGWNWTIENNEVRYNSQAGVEVNNGSIVRGNNIHHNGRIGITGSPVRGVRIRRNEIAFNNTGAYAGGHEGGAKVVGGSAGSFNLVFRGNQVHDNTGIGLWVDTNVRRVTIEMNTVENNSSIGIFYETSFDATIRNNTLRNNASDYVGESCYWALSDPRERLSGG